MASAPDYRSPYYYLATLDHTTSEHLNLYKKAIVGLPESDRYDLNRSKWPEFYQEFEGTVLTFWFKSGFLIMTTRYEGHVST